MAADDPPPSPATNPASDALNRTADAVAARQPISGLLTREHPRVSQLIGGRLLGAGGAALGDVLDVLLHEDGPLAIIQTGRSASSLVAVPTADLRWENGRLMLPGVTAEALRARPPFQFAGPGR